jgi:hypothetical protein
MNQMQHLTVFMKRVFTTVPCFLLPSRPGNLLGDFAAILLVIFPIFLLTRPRAVLSHLAPAKLEKLHSSILIETIVAQSNLGIFLRSLILLV